MTSILRLRESPGEHMNTADGVRRITTAGQEIDMLHPEQFKQLLVHENAGVRDLAAYSLRLSPLADDPEVSRLALESFGMLQKGNYSEPLLELIGDLLPTPQSLPRLLELLAQPQAMFAFYRLLEMLYRSPLRLLEEFEPQLIGSNAWPQTVRDELISSKSTQERYCNGTWEAFEEYWQDQDPDDYGIFNADLRARDLLVHALAASSQPLPANWFEEIQPDFLRLHYDEGEVDAAFCRSLSLIDVIGLRRETAAVPTLVELLDNYSQEVNTTAAQALARIGDPRAVALVKERFLEGDEEFQEAAFEFFGMSKLPEAEAALLELIEQDSEVVYHEGFPNVVRELVSEKILAVLDNDRLLDEPKSFLAVLLIHGVESPQKEFLLDVCAKSPLVDADIDDDEEYDIDDEYYGGDDDGDEYDRDDPLVSLEEYIEDLESQESWSFIPSNRRSEDWDDDEESTFDPFFRDDRPRPAADTIVNISPKIGRNEPCPCGSGKKYKKCCGAK